ncbi:Hypothetical protein PHPALM_15676 [Phytophthora palmivora]|uniref:SWIM-type domain-containing protein n=1 Tax=Phytophthora palmivora TaxID=4796 RepID=A0A2P4XRM4_9STRA|nr:Hypothetical protein PHPALM_15676 [Phytophthora palmivora]
METGSHETLVREPRKAKLPPRLKDYGRELATEGLKPARIRKSMARRYGLSEAEMPSCASNFTKRNLHHNDDYAEILAQIEELGYGPGVSDTQPFSFGWERDAHGKPNVGQGSDEKPFLVGLTTKRLLLNAARDPATFVFHMDATFKLTKLRILSLCRSFHLVALFIISQRLETLYVKALVALRKIFTVVTNQQFLLKYVMADAEAAQQNAVTEVFGMDSDFVYLMCFYHVMAKVHEKLNGVPDTLCDHVVADIYDLHFASCQAVYEEQVATVLARWMSDDRLVRFETYFNSVWVTSAFSHWQCYHTPSGYATTNNPLERFNSLIKRDYTLRTKHKIGTLTLSRWFPKHDKWLAKGLIGLLADCCGHQSVTPRVFKEVSDATQQLKARVRDFRQRELLVDMTPRRSSIEFLLVSPNPNIVRVLSRGYHRVYLPELGRSRGTAPASAQMSANYARMEVEGQPEGGWNVDVSTLSCGCKYNFKFSICIHVLFALQLKNYTGLDGKQTLVNRFVPKKRRRTQTSRSRIPEGRRLTNGYALSIE